MSNLNHKIGVIGLGYVGLPLAVSFSEITEVVGFDISKNRVNELNTGFDSTLMLSKNKLKNKNITYTTNDEELLTCNIYIVTVPTPIDDHKNPDLSYIISATELIKKYLKKGDIFVLESTVYPGTTEEICVPILEKNGLLFNVDFFCGYSPERINPGDASKEIGDIKKIVSGSNQETLNTLKTLYESIIHAGIHCTSSIKIAEAAKVIENTQRDINIALVNELSKIFNILGINTHEVIDAASTKWNFSDYRPGLVGGHCIGVDPYYLTYKAQEAGYHPEMILAGRRINDGMHEFVVEKIQKEIIKRKLSLKNLEILVLGISFKENCNDTRNSRSIDLVKSLQKLNINIYHSEPYIDNLNINGSSNVNYDNFKKLNKNFDVIVISVPHQYFIEDIDIIETKLKDKNSFIFDVKSSFKNKDFYSL